MRSYPCSTLVLGLWPETDSELSASEGTTAKNLQGCHYIIKKYVQKLFYFAYKPV